MPQKVIPITPFFSIDIARLLQISILQFSICKEKEGTEYLLGRPLGITITRSISLEHTLKYFKGFLAQVLINPVMPWVQGILHKQKTEQRRTRVKPADNLEGSYKLYPVRQHGVGRKAWPLELVLILEPPFTYRCKLGKLMNSTKLVFSHSQKAVTILISEVVLKIKKDNIHKKLNQIFNV